MMRDDADERTDTFPPLVVQDSGAFIIIRLNRPRERNPLSRPTLHALEQAFDRHAARTDLTAIIITGSEDVFASGADIRELQHLTPAAARDFSERGQRLFQKIADAPVPSIAAVNGYCMGGGLDLALACRARVASPLAVFAHPGARLGIITGWGGTQRLPRLIGTPRALEFFLTARRIKADEALRIGLVSEVADASVEAALKLAEGFRA